MSTANAETTAPVPDTIRACCSADEERTKIATPFAMTVDGRQWVAGTDGHCLAAVPFDGELRTDGPDAASLIPRPAPTHRVAVATLREWAGPPPPAPASRPCEECEGNGTVESFYCDCPNCDGDHPCEWCGGKGKRVPSVPIRYGKLLDGCLNMALLARVLQSAPDGEVTILHESELAPFAFRGPGWLALVMPVRPDSYGGRPVQDACAGIVLLASAASVPKAPPDSP